MKRELILSWVVAGHLAGVMAVQSAVAQDAPTPDQVGLTSQKETTLGRRLLMNSIGANNDIIHDMLDGALPMDNLEYYGRLQSISAMLYAFPNLYRVEANPYSEEAEEADPYYVSLSNMMVWENYEDFKLRSYDAYRKAQEAADAAPEDMLTRVEELEDMCDTCHQEYRTTFEYLDFDRIDDYVD